MQYLKLYCVVGVALILGVVACQSEVIQNPAPLPTQEEPRRMAQFLLLGSEGEATIQRQGWNLSNPVFSGTMASLNDYIELPKGAQVFVLCSDRLELITQSSKISSQCAVEDDPTELNYIPFFDLYKSSESSEKPYLIQPRQITFQQTPIIVWNSVPDAVGYQLYIEYRDDPDKDAFFVAETTESMYHMDMPLEYDARYSVRIKALFDGGLTPAESKENLAVPSKDIYDSYWVSFGEQNLLNENSLKTDYDQVMLETYIHGQDQKWTLVTDNLYSLRLDGIDTPVSNLILATLYLDEFELLQAAQPIYEEVIEDASDVGDLESCAIAHLGLGIIHHTFDDVDLGDFHLAIAYETFAKLGDLTQFDQGVSGSDIIYTHGEAEHDCGQK